ncbi:M14 family metallopeptidase [Dongia sp.]|uniref:M14 family metallopeptidase n=1 Tax=Dongia sp. TaxID=1977262 RepID=UPI0035B2C906
MTAANYFSATYTEAREKFRTAAKAAGADLISYVNPNKGPDGGELATDVARIGSRDARRLLIGMSATHGAEGFCGSGIQTGWLGEQQFSALPSDTAILLIHAINPFGFAWVRRVNEDNIDLNRNFIDHTKPYPENAGYRELRDFICPQTWDADSAARSNAAFDDYARRHSTIDLQAAIMNGQYWDKEGVFYGGNAPNWSHRTLLAALSPYAATVTHAAFIDLHTGLGPSGYGEIISNHTGPAPGATRVRKWFGAEVTMIDDGSSTSTAVTGDTQIGVDAALPHTQVTGITLEYGTVPVPAMIESVRADNWLHIHGNLDSELGRRIKKQIRDAFYTDERQWKETVFARAVDVLHRSMTGLSKPDLVAA